MSSISMYHGSGIKSYFVYKKLDYKGGAFYFTVERPLDDCRRDHCNSDIKSRGKKMRKFINLPIGSKPTYIIANLHRLECKECGRILQEKIPFAAKRKRYTKLFVRYVMNLYKEMTISSIAFHLKES